MRVPDEQQELMFSHISAENRVPKDHPLRSVRTMGIVDTHCPFHIGWVKKPVAAATTVTPTSPAMVRGRIEGHVGG